MSQEDTITRVHTDALELARLLRPAWPAALAALHASGVPLAAEDGTGDAGDAGGGDGGTGTSGDAGARTADSDKFDREYVEQLRKENAAARKRAQEAEARAKEFEDRDKTESEKLTEKAKADAARAEAAELKLMRFEVASEKGVPAKLAKFLTGSTKDELEQAADELLAEIGQTTSRTSFDGGARGAGNGGAEAVTPSNMDAAIRRAAGRA